MKLVEIISPTNANITRWASDYQDQWEQGHVAAGPASRFEWHFDPKYPLNNIHGKRDAVQFFQEDQTDRASEGQPDYYNFMLKQLIDEPIFLVQPNTLAYIWDGNHRVGASILTHRNTIPAYVGVPKVNQNNKLNTR